MPKPQKRVVERLEGLQWGMSRPDVTHLYIGPTGLIAHDFDAQLAKTSIGPELAALEHQREQVKSAFLRSYIEFGSTPTGYDATALRDEYTYNNHESLMFVEREGKRRYLFFFNDRLWKVYDEVPLLSADGAATAFGDIAQRLGDALSVTFRAPTKHAAATTSNASKGAPANVWQPATLESSDAETHVRLIDRSAERVVAIVFEDAGTVSKLAALRSTKPVDMMALDPAVQAVTQVQLSDPNAARKSSPPQKPPATPHPKASQKPTGTKTTPPKP